MPLYTDLPNDFKKAAKGIEADAEKIALAFQLQEAIEFINKSLAAAGITLRVRVRQEEDDYHLSFVQFGRETAYAKVKFDVKKEEASLRPEGKAIERISFKKFLERLLDDVYRHLDADEKIRFAPLFGERIGQLEKAKEIAAPAPA